MVLQTSCRCLRQVIKGQFETAVIYLNKNNADILNKQLQQQQHITITDLNNAGKVEKITIERYDRREYLKLPKVDFYQLRIQYDSIAIQSKKDIAKGIMNSINNSKIITITKIQEFTGNIIDEDTAKVKTTDLITYSAWLLQIIKESFGTLKFDELLTYDYVLREIFAIITMTVNDIVYYRSDFAQEHVRSNIRVAFCDDVQLLIKEDIIDEHSTLLLLENFTKSIELEDITNVYPNQEQTHKIILADKGEVRIDDMTQNAIDALRAIGKNEQADILRADFVALPEKDRTYHYLPYKFDSGFEMTLLKEVIVQAPIKTKGLEVYYNGDRYLSDFKIKCYKGGKGNWKYIGLYTPDFLIIQRKDNCIYKVLIVETKGEGYESKIDFTDRKYFIETEFKIINNEKFGYEKFDYLYLVDSETEEERVNKTINKVKDFFTEVI